MDLFQLGNKTYLLAIDYYSKYPEIALLTNTTSGGVVNAKFQNSTRSYYNKSAKELKPLKHGDIVRIQDDNNKCYYRGQRHLTWSTTHNVVCRELIPGNA